MTPQPFLCPCPGVYSGIIYLDSFATVLVTYMKFHLCLKLLSLNYLQWKLNWKLFQNYSSSPHFFAATLVYVSRKGLCCVTVKSHEGLSSAFSCLCCCQAAAVLRTARDPGEFLVSPHSLQWIWSAGLWDPLHPTDARFICRELHWENCAAVRSCWKSYA